jgi:signal recognition particle receptor subunit beta
VEHIILFAGPMGAGKTTAIRSLSEIPVISTEAANTDLATADKATTTVAMDYGEIGVTDEE